jgi:hypothetical protein
MLAGILIAGLSVLYHHRIDPACFQDPPKTNTLENCNMDNNTRGLPVGYLFLDSQDGYAGEIRPIPLLGDVIVWSGVSALVVLAARRIKV